MLSKYKHISFDLDGTLIYTSLDYVEQIVRDITGILGGEIKDPKSVGRFWFEHNRDEIIQKEFNLDPIKFWGLFRQIEKPENRYAQSLTYEDVEKTFKKLKKADKIISIITGCHFSPEKLKIDFDKNLCDLIFSIDHHEFMPKPDPKSFHYVLEKLKSNPGETLYIGNSSEDAFYAKNAGVDFVHIDRGEHPFDLREHAVKVISTLNQLFD